jgi:hypothetical protein
MGSGAEVVTVHRLDVDRDRCRCGGLTVSFDDGDADGQFGEGCEVSGRVFVPCSPLLDVDSPDYGRPETSRWDGEDHG